MLTSPKEVNGEMVQYKLAHIPMLGEINGKQKTITVVANGRYADEANKPKSGSTYTVQVDKRSYEGANGEPRTFSSFQMAE